MYRSMPFERNQVILSMGLTRNVPREEPAELFLELFETIPIYIWADEIQYGKDFRPTHLNEI